MDPVLFGQQSKKVIRISVHVEDKSRNRNQGDDNDVFHHALPQGFTAQGCVELIHESSPKKWIGVTNSFCLDIRCITLTVDQTG